jgi:hypothetical protein
MVDRSDRDPDEGALGPRETPMPSDQHGDRAEGVASAGTVGARTGTGGVGPGVAPGPGGGTGGDAVHADEAGGLAHSDAMGGSGTGPRGLAGTGSTLSSGDRAAIPDEARETLERIGDDQNASPGAVGADTDA